MNDVLQEKQKDTFSHRTEINMAKKTFESALARLEEITRELEDGEISLENSLKKFDEGIKLAEYCSQKLTDAKARVEILLNKDGKLTREPFPGNDVGDQDLSE